MGAGTNGVLRRHVAKGVDDGEFACDMRDPSKPSVPWSASPTAKAKTAVQRSVTALLDELAPERVLKRVDQLPGPVEQHRSPTGCVLQAANHALSVSWFTDAGHEAAAALGELHIILWRGTVARRGSTRNRKGATIVTEFVVRPIEPPADECVWSAADGTRYDTASLAAKCLSLLEGEFGAEASSTD